MNSSEQRTLTREQKEAVGLLSVGTFLEYFDLMLFVHMAVLLNEGGCRSLTQVRGGITFSNIIRLSSTK